MSIIKTLGGPNRINIGLSRMAILKLLVLASVLAFASACNQQMANEPKYIPLRQSDFYADGKSARPLVPNTVPRGYEEQDQAFYTGKVIAPGAVAAPPGTALFQPSPVPVTGTPGTSETLAENLANNVMARVPGQSDIDYFPIPVNQELLDRGKERYTIFCTPCHGLLGDGEGMIVKRGFKRPPSYHTDRLRKAPVGHFFDVITNGFGAMPDYSAQVPPRDRWAIIAYIRALQASENATISDVPAAERAKLENGGGQK